MQLLQYAADVSPLADPRHGSADPVLPVRGGDPERVLHARVHRELHSQRAEHVPDGGSSQGGR